MKILKRLGSLAAVTVFAVALSLNSTGCLNDSQLGPSEENQVSQIKTKPQFLKIGDGNHSLKKVITVSELITKKHGGKLTLKFKAQGKDPVEVSLTLKVSPESISEDRELAMSIDDELLIANVDVKFGPHGTVFSKPALLTIDARRLDLPESIDPANYSFFYYNPDTGEWEEMDAKKIKVDLNKGNLKVKDAKIPHFSRYAVGWGG